MGLVRAVALLVLAATLAPPSRTTAAEDPFHVKPEARLLFDAAMDRFRSGDIALALEAFLKAHEADRAVLSLDDGGLLDAAMANLRERLRVRGRDRGVALQLCELYAIKGRDEESLRCFRELIREGVGGPEEELARREAERLRRRVALLEEMRQRNAVARAEEDARRRAAQENAPITPPEEVPARSAVRDEKLERLEAANAALRRRVGELEDALRKLDERHRELVRKSETWRLYSNLFFADPRNVENLRRRRYDRPRPASP